MASAVTPLLTLTNIKMKLFSFLPLFTALIPVLTPTALKAAGILSPSDFVISIDNNRNLPGASNVGNEGPDKTFDGLDSSKWFSGGRAFSGLIVTPATAGTVVKSLSFTTGNDSPDRDPISYQLFGTNSAITSALNSDGLAEPWSLISSGSTGIAGPLSPATGRNAAGSLVSITNNAAFNSYKVVFTALRKAGAGVFDPVTLANGSTPNGIQLSEVRMFDSANANIFATPPTTVVAIDQTDSFTPVGERAVEAIDGSKLAASKYLNFGREGAGLIITPALGSTTIGGFQITTANDVPERDPGTYEIYGTNATIQSLEDSSGDAEFWTLITSGGLSLPPARNTDSGIIPFANSSAYTSYKVIFPENKGPDTGANSIQFSELELFAVPEPSSLVLLGSAGAAMLGRRRRV